MAITRGAKKANRQAVTRRAFNVKRKREAHDVLKDIKKLVSEKKMTEAQALLSKAYKAIDKSKKRGVIKKNTAARQKSNVARLVAVK